MTTAGATARTRPATIPVSETLPWLISAVIVGLVLYYVVGFAQGPALLFGEAPLAHEFVHDARHLLGFPCH